MSLLEFKPLSWFTSRKYSIVQNGAPVGEIDCALLREQATITAGGVAYTASREHLMGGAYFLETNGNRSASAEKPSMLHRLFTVQIGSKAYTLKAASTFGRAFVLTENDKEVGSITPPGFFSRTSRAELADDLALENKAFLIWLVILEWRRAKSRESSNNN